MPIGIEFLNFRKILESPRVSFRAPKRLQLFAGYLTCPPGFRIGRLRSIHIYCSLGVYPDAKISDHSFDLSPNNLLEKK
jgi:hypothetical protein